MGVGFVFLALGSLALVAAIQHLRLGRASIAWPKVVGQIVEVTKRKTDSGATKEFYEMKYSYVVDGVSLESKRFSFNGEFPDFVYAVGAMTDVYYNPRKPQISVLVPGYGFNNVMMLGISIIFIIVGIVVLTRIDEPQAMN